MIRLSTPEPSRKPQPTAKASALAHLLFERPDLEQAERFLRNFGLQLLQRSADAVYFRGAEPTAYDYVVRRGHSARFLGIGLRVSRREELEALAALPGASELQASAAPGGGECVRLEDPSGFVVEAVHGQELAPRLPCREPTNANSIFARPRINTPQRIPHAPPEVLRLGHVVLEAAQFQATSHFYTQHFGLIPSDVQVLRDGSPGVAFLRLDRGDTPTDHHTLALAQGIAPRYNHSAFEVVDADAVAMGQRVLREKGFRHAWGMGRHVLGSQIFDYWYDAWGDKHEYYSDGDLLTADAPFGVHRLSRDAMAQWGPPMPREFTRPAMSGSAALQALRNIRTSPDLGVRKLRMLHKVFG